MTSLQNKVARILHNVYGVQWTKAVILAFEMPHGKLVNIALKNVLANPLK